MKIRILAFLFLFILYFNCSSNRATVGIPANEQFVLGENEKTKFKVEIENISNKSIDLKIIDTKTKKEKQAMQLMSRQQLEIYVSKDEAAYLINNNNKDINIKVNLNKGVQGMRYEPVERIQNNLLQKDSLINDIDILYQALIEMHPGLYRYNNEKDLSHQFEQLKRNLPSQISERKFMIRLAQVIREIKCGHTYLNPWNMDAELRSRLFGRKEYFPIGFKILEGKFYVTENATNNTDINRGAEILSINGIPTHTIYDSLKTIAKTDGNNNSPIDHYLSLWNYLERNWHAFDIYFSLFFPSSVEEYTVSFQNYNESKINNIIVPAMTKQERSNKMKARYGEEILEKKKWKLKILSEDLAIMQLGTFAIWNWKDFDANKWYADAFRKLDSLNIKNLAIDIRGNGGGLSEPSEELTSYLYNDTISCNDVGKRFIRTTKFNPDLLPFIDSWVEILKTGLPEGLYTEAENNLYELLVPEECNDIIPKANQYNGKVYILGGSSNVSATFTLLKRAKDFKFATYIGEESGGNQQGINGGEYVFFTMPYSKMEVDIPLKYFAPKNEMPDEGIKPEIEIKLTQQDIAEDKDPYIGYIK